MIIYCEHLGHGFINFSSLPDICPIVWAYSFNRFYYEYDSQCDSISPYEAYELGIIRRKFLNVKKIQSCMKRTRKI